MSALPSWTLRPEVERVVADLGHWQRHGVLVLAVEPAGNRGARVGVRDLHPLVVRALQARYRFPVECWEMPTSRIDPEPL